MPMNRLWLQASNDGQAEYKSSVDQIQAELAEVSREIEVWDRAEPFLERLREMESSALELMVSGPPEDMAQIRERVRGIRTLLAEPRQIEARRQELEQALELALQGE